MKDIIIFIVFISYIILYSSVGVFYLKLNPDTAVALIYHLFGAITASALLFLMIDKEIFKDLFKQIKR